ncbi:MAG: arylsulfatase B [Chlamydiales bacterium]|jgi:arylsulfatase B
MILSLLALTLSLQTTQLPPARDAATLRPTPKSPNIVFILADDFGVNMVRAYGEASTPPCTPNIDGLAGEGLLFRNAWANPVCSPTRAAVLSGRYGFRTGVGTPGAGAVLDLSETTLPEVLAGYESACAGKWHLGGNNIDHPNQSGFDHYAGAIGGGLPDYGAWTKVTDGSADMVTTYATTDTANEAIGMIQTMQEPWFMYVAFNAPHTPFHEPPTNLCPTPTCVDSYCGNLGPNPTNAELAKAMAEAMDHEIGRFLTTLDGIDPNAMVIFMGDNGTARQATEAPFIPTRAKGTPYEGGVNVPLIVRGPGVQQGECQGLVSPTDIFATVADLAGVRVRGSSTVGQDGVSLVPYFSNPSASLRQTAYAEKFSPNGGSPPFADHSRTVRNERYKLIRVTGEPDEFYDLQLDAFENTNRLGIGLNAREQAAFDELEGVLQTLGVD